MKIEKMLDILRIESPWFGKIDTPASSFAFQLPAELEEEKVLKVFSTNSVCVFSVFKIPLLSCSYVRYLSIRMSQNHNTQVNLFLEVSITENPIFNRCATRPHNNMEDFDGPI